MYQEKADDEQQQGHCYGSETCSLAVGVPLLLALIVPRALLEHHFSPARRYTAYTKLRLRLSWQQRTAAYDGCTLGMSQQ
jgi:hypothetical protein